MSNPGPGWHDDGSGRQRWWDGNAWGQYADEATGQHLPPPKKKRTGLKIFIGLCVLGLAGFIGCAALIAGGINEAVNELNAEQEASAITASQFRQLEMGMSEQQVRQQLGKPPQDRQDLESEGVLSGEPTTSTCIYYNKDGGEWLDTYQLCFDDGRLTSKNDW